MATIEEIVVLLQRQIQEWEETLAADEEEDDFAQKAEEIRVAIDLLIMEEISHPGRGHTYFDTEKAPIVIPPLKYETIDYYMANPKKCLQAVGWTPQEILHLLGFVEAEIETRGAIHGNGRYRSCKPTTLARLFILLWFVQSQDTYYRMEGIFAWAKSSINDDVHYLGGILIDILIRELGTLWPNATDREILISFLPEVMRQTRAFFILDSTKVSNNDSTVVATREQHWNSHKGFGSHMIVFSNILGDLIWFEPFLDGNGSDIQQYRSSSPFQQANGCTFSADQTGFGDNAYKGASSNDPLSKDLVEKYNLNEVPDDVLPLATLFNDTFDVLRSTIERLIRGIKRFSSIGRKGRTSLNIHPERYVIYIL
jgi:hypothetical protein